MLNLELAAPPLVTLPGGDAGASYLLAATVSIENGGPQSIRANCSLVSGPTSFGNVSVTVPAADLFAGVANASLLGSVTVAANVDVFLTVECIIPTGGAPQSMTLTATRVGMLHIQP